MNKLIRKYTSAPIALWLGQVFTLAVALTIALLVLLALPAVLGGSVFGWHLPQPIVLMTVCS